MPHHARKESSKKAHSDPEGKRDQILRAFRATFTSDNGKLALDYLRGSTRHREPAFLPPAGGGPLDPYAAAFRDGRKSVVDEILEFLDTPEDRREEKPQAKGRD